MNDSCEREMTKRGRSLLITHALLWAAVILASSMIVAGADGGALTSLLIIVFVPSWFASDQLLRRALEVK